MATQKMLAATLRECAHVWVGMKSRRRHANTCRDFIQAYNSGQWIPDIIPKLLVHRIAFVRVRVVP